MSTLVKLFHYIITAISGDTTYLANLEKVPYLGFPGFNDYGELIISPRFYHLENRDGWTLQSAITPDDSKLHSGRFGSWTVIVFVWKFQHGGGLSAIFLWGIVK